MTSPRSMWTDLAAALSVGAGLVHAAAAGTHSGDATLVALFAAAALVQVGVGVALLRAPSSRLMLGSAALNVAAVAAWMLSRTVGLPFVASLAGPEPVGLQDLTAAALAAAAAAGALAARRPAGASTVAARLGWLPALALVPALVGVAAPHAHSESHDHEHGATASAAEHDESHVDGDDGGEDHAHDEDDAPLALAVDPVLVGADTTHATEPQLEAAVELVDATRAAVDSTMDVAAAEAAGYVWIGDGRRVGRYQHYINHAYLTDGVVLDPERIESLVFENTTEGPVLVSTMYLLDMGSTMGDAPDVAGDLTVWHDHQNLCWDESGTRLAGISTDGETCRPAGELRATPPMLHVWLVDNECGPFAGIEGHGSGDCATHGH